MTTGKPIALTIQTFVSKVTSLLFNMLSPKALGRHPSFRLGKVRQPDIFPGALGHWAFNLVSHAELA